METPQGQRPASLTGGVRQGAARRSYSRPAEQVFQNRAKAQRWMRTPKKRFEDQTPMQLLQTDAGARLVEKMLLQIGDGLFA